MAENAVQENAGQAMSGENKTLVNQSLGMNVLLHNKTLKP